MLKFLKRIEIILQTFSVKDTDSKYVQFSEPHLSFVAPVVSVPTMPVTSEQK